MDGPPPQTPVIPILIETGTFRFGGWGAGDFACRSRRPADCSSAANTHAPIFVRTGIRIDPSQQFSAVAESLGFGEDTGMSVAELPIQIDRERIARFCRERGIRKLSLFGSVLRDHFDPQRSDVDVLAEFDPGVLKNAGFQYFGYGEELSAIIGHKVDFCSRLHPLILGREQDELFPLYGARLTRI